MAWGVGVMVWDRWEVNGNPPRADRRRRHRVYRRAAGAQRRAPQLPVPKPQCSMAYGLYPAVYDGLFMAYS